MAAFQTWVDSLAVDDHMRKKLNNVQLLHECKDARDSHSATRHLVHSTSVSVPLELAEGTTDDANTVQDGFEEFDELGSTQQANPVVEYAVHKSMSRAEEVLNASTTWSRQDGLL